MRRTPPNPASRRSAFQVRPQFRKPLSYSLPGDEGVRMPTRHTGQCAWQAMRPAALLASLFANDRRTLRVEVVA